jgi:phospholipid/cholesterol/gamma-HCH transport system substrate-binding protein
MIGRRNVPRLIVTALLCLAALTACGHGGGLSVRARFTDVGDLAPGAPVMMDDVKVGKVTGIHLDGYRALVTMSLDPSAQVPRAVTARIRRTSLLGERIVDLLVPADLAVGAPALRDGDTIGQTQVRPDLEDLVQEGTDVLAPIAATDVATLVDEGYKGFAGNGGQLRSLLDDFQTIVHGYAGHAGDIESVISSLNQLNTTMAVKASAHALALGNSKKALDVLREESGRLKDAVHALARLSAGSRAILDEHSDEMARFFAQMKTILGELNQQQAAIDGLLAFAPLHNRNTQLVEYQEMNQVLQQFIICGFNDDPTDPARNCQGGEGTQ